MAPSWLYRMLRCRYTETRSYYHYEELIGHQVRCERWLHRGEHR